MIVFRYLIFFFLISTSGLYGQLREQLDKEIKKIILHDTEVIPRNQKNLIVICGIEDSTLYYQYGRVRSYPEELPETQIPLGDFTFFLKTTWFLNSSDVSDLRDKSIASLLGLENPYFQSITFDDLLRQGTMLPKMIPPQAQGEGFYDYLESFTYDRKDHQFLYSHFNEIVFDSIMTKVDEHYPRDYYHYISQNKGLSSFGEKNGKFYMNLDDIVSIVRDYSSSTLKADSAEPIRGQKKMIRDQYFSPPWLVMRPKKYYDIVTYLSKSKESLLQIGYVSETETFTIVWQDSKDHTEGLWLLILRMLNYNWKKK